MGIIKLQYHDATAESPTPTGSFWAIEVVEDGTLVLDDWSLSRWLSEPWGEAWDGTTPHRGGFGPQGGSNWAYLNRETQQRFIATAGLTDFDTLDDMDRLVAGLRELFPDYEVQILPAIPAPEPERIALASRGSIKVVDGWSNNSRGYTGWTWTSDDAGLVVIDPGGIRHRFERHESRSGGDGWDLMIGVLQRKPA